MTVWFTSDLHFSHKNIIRLCGRPFEDIDEMNETLIANFNSVVKSEDELYILGDASYKGNANELIRRLQGKKTLVIGNHDSGIDTSLYEGGIHQILEAKLPAKGRHWRFVMCHYPFAEWNGFYNSAIHLHGHQHNKPDYNEQMREHRLLRYDVGVDANNFYPVSAEQIVDFFRLV